MFLQRKVDRAMKWSRERSMIEQGRDPEQEELDRELEKHGKGQGKDLPSMEELRAEELERLQNEPMDKKDIGAMIIAAFLTIFPVCVIAILAIALAAYFFFIR